VSLIRREIDIVTSIARRRVMAPMNWSQKDHRRKTFDSHTIEFNVLTAFDILKDPQDAIKVLIKFPD
jgi:hypothetical protein